MNDLIDTNIIFYSIDKQDARKHEIAKTIMKNAFIEGAVVSVQNIGEFFHQSRRKFNPVNLEASKILALATIASENVIKLSYDDDTLYKSITNCKKGRDFWNLVLYYTMLENGITRIITENTKDFEGLSGIEALNPF